MKKRKLSPDGEALANEIAKDAARHLLEFFRKKKSGGRTRPRDKKKKLR